MKKSMKYLMLLGLMGMPILLIQCSESSSRKPRSGDALPKIPNTTPAVEIPSGWDLTKDYPQSLLTIKKAP